MMAEYDKITELQVLHYQMQKKIAKDEFKREVHGILQTRKYEEIFDFSTKLPGISPVKEQVKKNQIELR